ncbi:benzaldehyde dehydrogenase [Marinomonas mediterranea]|jgi:benzaldehyde dehydrogenase (NAD+) (EC 1.2.1.28)|uniref:Benzaldehyde dehydrogenase (NAD(+)) n=1 Tax=Marinomonas mediterranea (strain ATCC 700492 / JCM 21426 / NBRC 103028 / MMB-1) TaxID=717774 RepID=F2K043_MARM1|nr:benzaldehyde dehydrogenase [Marinomonas mediterranea]ADZ93257.1 Benzaldehyde dehydrogenase (NAD(+)) [Marinomonas mediterranea MMB-1]WCN11145.1 aldehyde dehydrogenase family protein [Marinomonas mediterranea]WCN15208.1 aldehyde dehydrogenase family protein [Marinomonas mediterranea]WCN19252.1 aldehyde dehydrogenase family protein [Marinomonas mediterranea MMB-1]
MSNLLEQAPWKGKLYNGQWQTASQVRDVIEPATLEPITQTGIASADDVLTACHQAQQAQKEWAAVPPREKSTLFLKAADYLDQNFDELSMIIARETGGIVPKGQHEVREVATILRLAAGLAMQPTGYTLATDINKQSYAQRIPLGVIGVISPFNFPFILSTRSVAPALALGNAVVSKPDPQTPMTGGYLLALALEYAGFPKGIYQVVPGDADAGAALCEAPEVAMVAFTGSTAAGRKVGETCGRNLKKVALELGGKSSLIILEDADLELAASNVAWGTYMHQGQICMASGRVLVHESIADQLIAKMAEKASHLPVGNPATEQVALGPLINERQLQRVHSIVEDAVKAGAKLEAGGSYEKLFYKPTVLSGVKPGMRAFDEEIFGPVATIVTFKTDEEAIALATQTEYGLAGAVISPDVARAKKIGSQLHVGLLHINDQTVNDECNNPFGGCGASGNGQGVCGPNDLDTYTHWQWVTEKSAPPKYPF